MSLRSCTMARSKSNPNFSYPWAYLGLNDLPADCFEFWELWFGALAHPQRLDDETCPIEHECYGNWAWRQTLEGRYGSENVVKVTPTYLLATQVYSQYLNSDKPIESDSCAYVDAGRIKCNHSCQESR